MQTTSLQAADSAPRLSIVIATWNAAPTLERCLQSIAGQKFTDWELLIADGASDDGTVDLIRKHESHIAWWQSQKDGGIYDAWNQALVHARGEYICFLGADDALRTPDVLRELLDCINHDSYDLISSRGMLRTASWQPRRVVGGPWIPHTTARRLSVNHPGLLHHRRLFEKYGKFDKRYRIVADLDFLLRLPKDIRTLHLDLVSVDIQDGGISRKRFWLRLRERRQVHSAHPDIGPMKAWLYWADKAWRRPIALILGLPH